MPGLCQITSLVEGLCYFNWYSECCMVLNLKWTTSIILVKSFDWEEQIAVFFSLLGNGSNNQIFPWTWASTLLNKQATRTSRISTSCKGRSKFTAYYFQKCKSDFRSRFHHNNLTYDYGHKYRCALLHLCRDADAAGKGVQCSSAPSWECKMEVSNASCGVMRSFILKTERIKYIYIKERKSV